MTRKKPPSYRTKHRLNKKYLLYTGGIYMCFYCRSYIVNKTFSKYNSKSTNNFSFRNELNDIILYNPQNEMFRLLGTKRSFSQNETFFFSHP